MWRMGVRDGSARRGIPASWFNSVAQVQVRQDLDAENSKFNVQDTSWTTGYLHYRSQESNYICQQRSQDSYQFKNPFTRRPKSCRRSLVCLYFRRPRIYSSLQVEGRGSFLIGLQPVQSRVDHGANCLCKVYYTYISSNVLR